MLQTMKNGSTSRLAEDQERSGPALSTTMTRNGKDDLDEGDTQRTTGLGFDASAGLCRRHRMMRMLGRVVHARQRSIEEQRMDGVRLLLLVELVRHHDRHKVEPIESLAMVLALKADERSLDGGGGGRGGRRRGRDAAVVFENHRHGGRVARRRGVVGGRGRDHGAARRGAVGLVHHGGGHQGVARLVHEADVERLDATHRWQNVLVLLDKLSQSLKVSSDRILYWIR